MLQRWGCGREAGEKTAVDFCLWPLGDSSTTVPRSLVVNVMIAPICCGLTEGQTLNSQEEKQSLAHGHTVCKWGKPNLNPALSGHGADVPSNTL